MRLLLAVAGAVLALAAPASAEERLLTLYSPPIDSEPYVHKSTTVRAQARRRPSPAAARLCARLQGAGAGRQQGPRRQAAAGVQDDGPPPPLLHVRPRRRRLRLPRRRVSQRARGGAPQRAVRGALPARGPGALRRPQRDRGRYGAGVVGDRDGHEPLPALEALLRAHEALVHDRAADPALSDDGRRLPPPGQRHGLRRARRRLDVRRPLVLDGAVQRPHPVRRLAPPRRRHAPDAGLEDLQPQAARRARLLRRARTIPTTRSARSCTSRGRSPTARSAAPRASRSPPARCWTAPRSTTTRRCTSRRWASGS